MQQESTKEFEQFHHELIRYHGSEPCVHVPEHITVIGEGAFYGSGIRQVYLPQGLVRIDRHAFAECTELTNIELPDGLEIIGDSAFENCRQLEELHVPPTVHYIGKMAFSKCSSLRLVTLPEQLSVLAHGLFLGDVSLREIRLPKQLARIEASVFYFCKSLEQIEIPKRVADIYPQTFYGCHGLKKGYIPGMNLQSYGFEEQLIFTVLYLSNREQYTYWEQQIFEAFIGDCKRQLMEKITQVQGSEAMEGLVDAGFINKEEMEQWIMYARSRGTVEFCAKLLQKKEEKFGGYADMWEI